MVGSSFPYSEWLPKEGQARGVQIDLDPTLLGMRYPIEVPLWGDSAATLRELIPLLQRKDDRSWREEIERNVGEWWRLMEDRAAMAAKPVNPERVISELSARLPDRAIVTADSGSSTNWFARQLRLRDDMMASLSGTLATMGPAVPYAIAAKFAHPDRPVIAIAGDGAFEMNGMNELITIAKYRQRWSDQRLVICIFNNEDLNQVTWEQRVLGGDPKFPGSQDIPDCRAAAVAELYGLVGVRVDDPDDLGSAWDRVLAADRPAVLEVVTDPNVAPLPPHIQFEQAKEMAAAMLKGDPDGFAALTTALRGKLREFVPGR
jgi:pyruvate dehydrogenase (quinone)